ncbi:MAG: universal stress protein [Coleofasciculus sp. S288]|nr:universal stress protein [Coleofasciculus sp. S288]
MRYKKVLVALDRSPHSEAVFEQAVELAKKEEASLMLFHCLPFENQGVGWYADVFVGRELINFSREMQALFQKESEEAREWIASYCQKATAQGVPTEWDLKVGDAGSAIRELADTWGADLVVLGRRGRRGLAEIFLGSVSNYVVHYAPCSVLIVQGISETEEKVPVAATQAKSEEMF